MKKLLFIIVILLFLPTLTFAEVDVRDNGYKEQINNYDVTATLDDNATIKVVENIAYDFGTNQKHGIYRYIPNVYKGRNGNPRQSLKIISVKDGSGSNQPYETSYENNSEVIKVGDADKLVSGMRNYQLEYSLTHMVSANSDGDLFRWDAIGTGWQVPINNITITLTSSNKQTDKILSQLCYFGETSSTAGCKLVQSGDTTKVQITRLAANSGVTVEIFFFSGTFPAPSNLEVWIWEAHWYYWLPLVALLGFFALWYKKGRDPFGRGTIVPMYEGPKGLTPFEATILMEDNISKKALPAAIISLAVQGYIKIHRTETKKLLGSKPNYELELLRPLPATASPLDVRVLNLFFTGRDRVNLNDLGDTFAGHNASLHSSAYRVVTEKGYFRMNPNISRAIYFGLAGVVLTLGIFGAIYLLSGPIGFLCFALPGIIGLGFAFIMPVKTKTGALVREELLGLKLYIQTAEIDRIKFHNAPEKSPAKFEELLPYAIIFGLEKKWADEFKDIYQTPPGWYDGNFNTFTAVILVNELTNFSNAAISAAVSSSASAASGGFGGVGGGAGGGGGGSW